MSFLASVQRPKQATGLKTVASGGFLGSVRMPPADFVPPKALQVEKPANPVKDFFQTLVKGPVERATAVVESVKQRSLEPLKQSFSRQFSERTKLGTTASGRELTIPKVVADLAGGFGPGEAPLRFAKANPNSFLAKVLVPGDKASISPPARPAEIAPPAPAQAPGATVAPVLKPAQSTGPARTSGLAASVEAQAVEKKLTDTLGELPQYNQVNMAEQAQKAADLIGKDLEQARRIALGQEQPPPDILPESVFVAMEQKALEKGDVELLRDLATRSSLSTEATAMGQRIRTLGERGADSPVATIKELRTFREESFTRRTGRPIARAKREAANEIRDVVRKSAPTKETWDSFISSIECNY